MRLIYPFRNRIINAFHEIFSAEGIRKYEFSDDDNFGFDNFSDDLEFVKEQIPNFHNEIEQVVHTTDESTIGIYLSELNDYCNHFDYESQTQRLRELCEVYNEEQRQKFIKEVESATNEFFSLPERKLKNLEEYEEEIPNPTPGSLGRMLYNPNSLNTPTIKIKKVNHNFYCIQWKPHAVNVEIIPDFLSITIPILNQFTSLSRIYINRFDQGEYKIRSSEPPVIKPIIFVEGSHDIKYITKAGRVLGKSHLLEKFEVRERDGFPNLDKLWRSLTDQSWEIYPIVKIFLYDCDTKKTDSDSGFNYKRIIPSIEGAMISKGIENLFPDETIIKAREYKIDFIDSIKSTKIIRGRETNEETYEVNKDEKTNLCNYLCEIGDQNDFRNFDRIFTLIENIVINYR